MEDRKWWLATALTMLFAVLISRWLATIGEPQAVWFWCHILKVCT
jgi:hypothetical protein